MAYVNNTHGTLQQGFSGRIAGLLAKLDEAIARRRLYRETVNELRLLSNRELRDIGLTKGEITRVAREAAYEF